jgi:hypothetical protein
MLSKYFIFVLLNVTMLCSSSVFAQVKKAINPAAKTGTNTPKKTLDREPKYTRWSIKGGGNLSVIYLARNVKEKNNEPGYCGGLTYEINNFVRVSSLVTRFRPINIEPTWLNVKANTYEANLEILARFPNQKTLLYPFAGFSYNTFSGFFTGQSDYLNLKEYYAVNSTIKNQWLGFNLGTGLEHNFGILGVFIDYRMRIGKQENAINIMDVCYTGGLKIRFPYGKLAKTMSSTNDRFHWF